MSSAAELTPVPEPVAMPRRGRSRRLILAAWLLAGVAALIAAFTVSLGKPVGPVDTPIIGDGQYGALLCRTQRQ